jgi:hypothetical protein
MLQRPDRPYRPYSRAARWYRWDVRRDRGSVTVRTRFPAGVPSAGGQAPKAPKAQRSVHTSCRCHGGLTLGVFLAGVCSAPIIFADLASTLKEV